MARLQKYEIIRLSWCIIARSSTSVHSDAGSSEAQTSVAGRILAACIDLEEDLADADLAPWVAIRLAGCDLLPNCRFHLRKNQRSCITTEDIRNPHRHSWLDE